jgi:hypothetical protein
MATHTSTGMAAPANVQKASMVVGTVFLLVGVGEHPGPDPHQGPRQSTHLRHSPALNPDASRRSMAPVAASAAAGAVAAIGNRQT